MGQSFRWHQGDDGTGNMNQRFFSVATFLLSRRYQQRSRVFICVLAGILVLSLVRSSQSFVIPPPLARSFVLRHSLEDVETLSRKLEGTSVPGKPEETIQHVDASPLEFSLSNASSLGTEEYPHSDTQMKSILSTAPAVLLKSGPGTGKSYALASRIAYLIRSGTCRPEHMVVLSFTNRDANALKGRAIDMLFPRSSDAPPSNYTQQDLSQQLWSGTIHSFAISLYRAYSPRDRGRIRVITSKEMRMRVDKCLVNMLASKTFTRADKKGDPDKLGSLRLIYRDALGDLRQSRGMLLHQVCRCLELWKEAGLLPPPGVDLKDTSESPTTSNSVTAPATTSSASEIKIGTKPHQIGNDRMAVI